MNVYHAVTGSDPTSPIYLGCRGLVYDMTSGEEFYGREGPYAQLAGRDASRALATMELFERVTQSTLPLIITSDHITHSFALVCHGLCMDHRAYELTI
jgi:hypothetical protein